MKPHSENGGIAAADKPLPKGFSAKTDTDAGTVTISKDAGSVTIALSSYASMANAIHDLWPDGAPHLEPGATLTLADGFTGRSASVAASALSDTAAVLAGLVIKASADVKEPAAAVAEAPPAVSPEEGKAAVTTRKRANRPAPAPARAAAAAVPKGRPAVVQADPAPSESPDVPQAASAAEAAKPQEPSPAKARGKAKAPAKAKGKRMARASRARPVLLQAHEAPSWFSSLKKRVDVDDGAGGKAEMVRCGLALDPKRANHVKSRSKDEGKATGWGYEVVSGGRHVAWVIASSPEQFIVTDVEGDPAYTPSKHKLLAGVTARLTAIVLPKFLERAA